MKSSALAQPECWARAEVVNCLDSQEAIGPHGCNKASLALYIFHEPVCWRVLIKTWLNTTSPTYLAAQFPSAGQSGLPQVTSFSLTTSYFGHIGATYILEKCKKQVCVYVKATLCSFAAVKL